MLVGCVARRFTRQTSWLLGHQQARCYDVNNYEAKNEPVLEFLEGSEERTAVESTLAAYEAHGPKRVPICIGDKEIFLDGARQQVAPFDHKRQVANYDWAPKQMINEAIDNCLAARDRWERTPWQERAQIFLKAADLFAGPYRSHLLATTMLGQAKTVQQAEIDAAAELVDFLRFNVASMAQLAKYQPISTQQANNTMHFRGCEGFWAAVTPFNFTAIGGNLAASPAFAGNSVVWKPTDTAVLSNYLVYSVLREAGLPAGVINFVPADGPVFGSVIAQRPELAGINFTGSVGTFRNIWSAVSSNLSHYRTFPRLIGECGGKNFHFLHPSADVQQAVICTVRAAFEYSGQKCSACSRLYVPKSLWPQFKEQLLQLTSQLKFDTPLRIASTFSSAVIDDKAFARINNYQKLAKQDKQLTVLAGGAADDTVGYFIEPTVIQTQDPHHRIMNEEIFGPVLTAYVYEDSEAERTLDLVNGTTPFALTGAVFAADADFVELARDRLRDSAGNFYINVMSTGSVVGQQPFGGARLSGTNDKAGGPHYLLKFMSPLAVKEQVERVSTHLPPHVTQ